MNERMERHPNPSEIHHRIGARGQLTINNVSGEVELRATDGEEVSVVVQGNGLRSDSLPITVHKGEGSLTIDVEKRAGSFGQFGTWFGVNDGVEFEVMVPRAARVTVNTVSADIASHFLSGEQSYKTVSGDVEANPDGGKIRVQTVSGDIDVKTSEPAELSVNSTSGDVQVQGSTIERFDARTVSGDIQFDAALGVSSAHSIETVSGDVSIESPTGVTVEVRSAMDMRHGGSRTKVSGDGAAQVRFRTLSGDCHVLGAHDMDSDQERGRHGRGRHGGKHDRFERQLERRIQDQVRRGLGVSRDDIDFPGGMPPMPPTPPMPPAPPDYGQSSYGHGRSTAATQRQPVDQLEVLRALERGEIDVEEAARRLQEA
ncbi:MAG TPA: DUF4097 family beta strand repeat-containing protein [Candidatus Limnocylindrales bacterium]